jgi:hypothetical protein
MAEPTGIEPAIFGVTGRHVNRYTTAPHQDAGCRRQEFVKSASRLFLFLLLASCLLLLVWWAMTGSNCRPPACKAGALPAELIAHVATDKDYYTQFYCTCQKIFTEFFWKLENGIKIIHQCLLLGSL